MSTPVNTYATLSEMDADRAQLTRLHAALNAANNALRLDDCRLWTIRGRGANYLSTDGGEGWLVYVTGLSARAWGFAKKRMASFCEVTQDGDDEGVLRILRLPTPEEAAELRDIVGIRQTREAGRTPEELSAMRTANWQDQLEKPGLTNSPGGEVPDSERLLENDPLNPLGDALQ